LRNRGLSRERDIPKYDNAHVVVSSPYRYQISCSSSNTPKTTSKAPIKPTYSQNFTELSRAGIALSRAEMDLSNAEVSVGKSEAKLAIITFAIFVLPLGYGLALIILAFMKERVSKKTIKRPFTA
jgi:hypothetical protein